MLGAGRERIRFFACHPVGANDRELVATAVADVRDEGFPNTGRFAWVERVGTGAPVVPITDDTNRARIWGPYSKIGSVVDDVRAELFVKLIVRALIEEEEVVGGERRLHGARSIRYAR